MNEQPNIPVNAPANNQPIPEESDKLNAAVSDRTAGPVLSPTSAPMPNQAYEQTYSQAATQPYNQAPNQAYSQIPNQAYNQFPNQPYNQAPYQVPNQSYNQAPYQVPNQSYNQAPYQVPNQPYNQIPAQVPYPQYNQMPNQVFTQPYNPMPVYPVRKPPAKVSVGTVVITVATAVMALMMTIAWFLPVAHIGRESFTMLELLDMYSGLGGSSAEEAVLGYWVVIVLCAIAVVWAAIPKMWAAIVGLIYTLIPMIICIIQVADWQSNDIDMAIGADLLVPFAVLTMAATVVKLILTIIDFSKSSKVNVSINNYGGTYIPR